MFGIFHPPFPCAVADDRRGAELFHIIIRNHRAFFCRTDRCEEEFGNVCAPTWRELTKAGMSGIMYQTHLMGAVGRVADLAENDRSRLRRRASHASTLPTVNSSAMGNSDRRSCPR